jgi:group I intron endonuclease
MTTKKQGEIYLITNRVNNKKYVGQAVCITEKGRIAGAEKRFKTHLNKALKNKNECPRLYTAIRKHGKDNFSMEILTKCDMDIIDSQEIHFIKLHNTINPNGYNLESGGKKNKKLNFDTRKLISDKHRFLQVSKENKSKILDVMKQLNISDIPMGIHYSNNTVTLYEGFTVHLNDIHMSFLSKGRTLVKKLQQALECYKILQEKDFEKLKKFKDDIHNKTNTLISHS